MARRKRVPADRSAPRPSAIRRAVIFTGRVVLLLVVLSLVLVILGMTKVHDAYRLVRDNIEQVVQSIELPDGSEATRVFARDYKHAAGGGTVLAKLYLENRRKAEYREFPPMLIACVLSTEDKSFYTHGGVDLKGMLRAGYNIILRGGEVRGGGSTITQQLSRNVFLPYIKSQKTINRKMQEIILAGALEERFTKQEILEAYLNHIYFGAGAYGVKSAAQTYFGKELDELTLAECAMLAGLPQMPSKQNPIANPEAAEARRRDVLELLRSRLQTDYIDRLIDEEPDKFADLYITDADIDAALAEPIVLAEQVETGYMAAPYFTSYVRDHVLYPSYGADQVLRQGMTVVTTLDPQYQRWAEEILKENIDSARDKKRVSQGALVLIETKTGEVLACVGGYEWLSHTEKGDDKYNRAMLGGRPTGSAFKPFTYATAYEQGFPVSLTIWDGPNVEISKKLGKPWPKNSNGTYRGWVSIPNALQWSRNAASVDLMVNCTGIKPVIETARKMGITADLEEVPSLTLGVASIKPLEMAEAFATFANMGRHVDSILVKKVYNQNGILYETNDSAGAIEKRSNVAFSENTAWIMVQNMRRAVEHGTGVNARVPGVQIAGKTGTNDDYVDAWFIGYSPELVCAVWVGNDDYAVGMKRMFGGDLPAKTFSALMKRIYTRQTKTVGEGDEAAKVVIYEPRYTQTKFEKPAGATFNGFPGAIVGAVLVQDEEGNWVPEEQAEEAGAEEEQQPGDDSEESADPSEHEFYEQWEPPPHVYF